VCVPTTPWVLSFSLRIAHHITGAVRPVHCTCLLNFLPHSRLVSPPTSLSHRVRTPDILLQPPASSRLPDGFSPFFSVPLNPPSSWPYYFLGAPVLTFELRTASHAFFPSKLPASPGKSLFTQYLSLVEVDIPLPFDSSTGQPPSGISLSKANQVAEAPFLPSIDLAREVVRSCPPFPPPCIHPQPHAFDPFCSLPL